MPKPKTLYLFGAGAVIDWGVAIFLIKWIFTLNLPWQEE